MLQESFLTHFVLHSFLFLGNYAVELAVCFALMIVTEIARLTHAKRVGESLLVSAISGLKIAAEPTVAGTAKVLGVVLPVCVLALSYQHGSFTFCGAW